MCFSIIECHVEGDSLCIFYNLRPPLVGVEFPLGRSILGTLQWICSEYKFDFPGGSSSFRFAVFLTAFVSLKRPPSSSQIKCSHLKNGKKWIVTAISNWKWDICECYNLFFYDNFCSYYDSYEAYRYPPHILTDNYYLIKKLHL